MTRHTIRVVRFDSAIDGDVECSCGWEGRVVDHGEHRKNAGLPKGRSTLGPSGPAPEHIVASRLRGKTNSRR